MLGGADFYPLLAEVGKNTLNEQAWLEYAVVHHFVQCSGEVTTLNLKHDVGRGSTDKTICSQMPSRATAAPVFVGPHRAMMAKRGGHRAVLRGDNGHHSLKTPPISAYHGKSPCIVEYQAQRPEKTRNTFLAGQKVLLING